MSTDSPEFKVQLLETFAALITAAFGLVAALAWNEAIKEMVARVFGSSDDLVGLVVYAIIVTVLAVIMTLLIARALGKAKKTVEASKKEE
jgi:membrane protein YdbS with pleckstrin-like domain